MPLHERGLSSDGRPVNPGEIALAWLRSVKSFRQENDRAAAVDENGETVDFADVRRTPAITGDS